MRVLVTGDRHWDDPMPICAMLFALSEQHEEEFYLIEGCAPGADNIAHKWGEDNLSHSRHMHFPADWKRFGRGAGPIRNQAMLDQGRPDLVLAYHDDLTRSKGTVDMIRRSREAGIKVLHIRTVGG